MINLGSPGAPFQTPAGGDEARKRDPKGIDGEGFRNTHPTERTISAATQTLWALQRHSQSTTFKQSNLASRGKEYA